MSQTFFSKQDSTETVNRLTLLGNLRGNLTVWLKGKKDKYQYKALSFHKDRMEVALDSKEQKFTSGDTILCTFELRGMNFFSEVIYQVGVGGFDVLQFKNTLFKSERRNSYRLLTYPIFEVYSEFDIHETYQAGNLVDLKTKSSQTSLFKNFLKIVEPSLGESGTESGAKAVEKIKIRIQDLSTTGMALHVSELEAKYFSKDQIFNNVNIRFTDEVIQIPKAKIVYMVDYLSQDKKVKKYKLGIHFEDLPSMLDDQIGKKINYLLRLNDSNKDFENFIK